MTRPARPSHDDDVVKTSRAVLNQGDNGPARAQTFLNGRGVPAKRLRRPSPRAKLAQQIVAADTSGGWIDESANVSAYTSVVPQ